MDQREEIKQKIDLVELIGEYVPLKKAGRNFKALCPFHEETAPSFMVSPERQIWKCFGCQKGGDHFTFLMEVENLEFGEALQVLAKKAGVKLKGYRPGKDEKRKNLLWEINHLAGEFYHYLLTKHPAGQKARDYFLSRGIKPASWNLFKLGFAPGQWDALFKFLTEKKKYAPADLELAGLVIKGRQGFYDRFRNRAMFVLNDHRGHQCGFAGRVFKAEVKEAKYVNTPETPVYHKSDLLYGLGETKEVIKKADAAVLVEGELDLISSYQAGVKNVVAIKGSALGLNQVRLLKRFTPNLILALDKDAAGDEAARRGIKVAEQAGMIIKVVLLEGGKDPDEVAQKNPRLWQKLVKKAVPVYDYFLDTIFARHDPRTAAGKRQISQELIPLLAQISDEIVKAHYLQKTAEKLGVSEEVVGEQIRKTNLKAGSPRSAPRAALDQKASSQTVREKLELYFFTLALLGNRWPVLVKKKAKVLVKTPRLKHLQEVLEKYLKKYKTFKTNRLAKMLPAEIKDTFDQFYLFDFPQIFKDEEKLAGEIKKTLFRLEELTLREELVETAQLIAQLEKKDKLTASEKKKQKRMDIKFRDLSLSLAKLKGNLES